VCDLYRTGDNSLGAASTKIMHIVFTDEPRISVCKIRVMESSKPVTGSLGMVNKVWNLSWFNKTTTHSFKCVIINYKFEYRIICGSVTEVITEEQYNTLIDTHENNKQELKQEANQAKIDLRLKRYVK
jgi:hypothetical protein